MKIIRVPVNIQIQVRSEKASNSLTLNAFEQRDWKTPMTIKQKAFAGFGKHKKR